MNVITLDFETYYNSKEGYTLKKMTVEEYIRSPLFQAIGVGVKLNNGETEWASGTHRQLRAFLNKFPFEESLLVCQNTAFDGFILSEHFSIYAKWYADTMLMAKGLHGFDAPASLAALAQLYGVGNKGNEVVEADGLRREDFSDMHLSVYGDYCVNDVELTHSIFNKMVCNGFPRKEMQLIDLTLRMFIYPRLVLDTKLLHDHLANVRLKKEELLASAQCASTTLMCNTDLADMLRSYGVEPPTKVSPRTGKTIYAFAKTDEGIKALMEHENPNVQALIAARLGVKSTLEETRTERLIGIAGRGLLPIPLKYYGARTGRWSAEGAINMQNMPRGSTIKKAIVAPDGYVIIGSDLSNIELRVGLWLAGQWDKLELLRNGVDLYKDFASSVFNVPYDEVTTDQRFVGKTSQLSLIYGTGAKKLRSQIKILSGTDIGEDLAMSVVDIYRQEYVQVKEAWYAGDAVLKAIRRDALTTYEPNGVMKLHVHGKKGVQLPSGLFLTYPGLSASQDGERGGWLWTYKTRKGLEKIYGPKVFQNCVQALARCVMGEQMIQIAKRYPIALTIHDALYVIAPEREAEEAMSFVLSTMRTAPEWLPGIPLDAEAHYGRTLGDC